MIPTSIAGLILLVAVLTPGYAWVRYSERRFDRPKRSGVLEVAEILAVGVTFTTASLIVLLLVSEWLGDPFPSTNQLARSGEAYFRANPWIAIIGLVALVVLGVGLALGLAHFVVFRSRQSTISHSTIWHKILGESGIDRPVRVAVELTDGRKVEGYLAGYDLDDSETRSIALQPPIRVQSSVSGQVKLEARLVDRVVLEGSAIKTIWVVYDFEVDGRSPAERFSYSSPGQ